ncbi:MAG: DUF2750 domain-containing protein [Gammaproteobacteria bacterium]|nr:DUF2750 domain-containing protein [Gammaproteobacteria bacterium]
MLLDSATVESNFQRFIERVIENEAVFYLSNEDGVANAVSNEDEKIVILMFWSDRAYATRAKQSFDEGFNEVKMELFDFLYPWLPGMSGDGVLAGPNWNGDLVGREIDPFELRELIEGQMPSDLLEKYELKYSELANNT